MKKLILSLFISLPLMACPNGYDLKEPLHIPIGSLEAGGITEAEFNQISTELETLYAPTITVVKDWANTTVNAYAKKEGEERKVFMFGGLARHKTITADGYALVVCHEIGHHLGGFPKYDGIDIGWATSEGQSDYYSTMKCLRKYWQNSDNAAAILGKEIPQKLLTDCGSNWLWNRDEALCIRSGMAGFSVSQLFAALAWNWKKPKFETPDSKQTDATFAYHPKAQCRLDTYFQGALCEARMDDEMRTETEGACHETLGHKSGMRPRCWFKPTL